MLFPGDTNFTPAQAKLILSRIEPRLTRCVREAKDALLLACGVVEIMAPALDYLGARAHLLNALVVEMIRREFAGPEDGLNLTEENGFLELQVTTEGFDVRADLRFKAVDVEGRSCNAGTKNQWVYRNQLPLIGDDHAQYIARLTLGWRLNVTATDLEDINIVYLKGEDPLWQYSVNTDLPPDSHPIQAPDTAPDTGSGTKYVSKSRKGKDAQGSA
jgi:hypothetical protein